MSKKSNQKPIVDEQASSRCEVGSNCESFNKAFRLIYKINKRIERIQRNSIQKIQNIPIQNEKITPAQYLILSQLWENDGLSQIELAKGCSCSKSTVTGIIDTMEKNGLIQRIESSDDRRKKLIKLTNKGKEARIIMGFVDNSINNCCQGFNALDLKNLLELLQKLFDSLKPI